MHPTLFPCAHRCVGCENIHTAQCSEKHTTFSHPTHTCAHSHAGVRLAFFVVDGHGHVCVRLALLVLFDSLLLGFFELREGSLCMYIIHIHIYIYIYMCMFIYRYMYT